MTLSDWLLFLAIAPPLVLLAGCLGRKYQRDAWGMDRPYSERIVDLKPWKKAA